MIYIYKSYAFWQFQDILQFNREARVDLAYGPDTNSSRSY